MIYSVELKTGVQKAIAQLPIETRIKVAAILRTLPTCPRPNGCIKIKGTSDTWRIRTGDYRIVYEIHSNVLVILVVKVAHRREVYR